MKLITKSAQNRISEKLLKSIENIQWSLSFIESDLKFEIGKSILNENIGSTKFDEKPIGTLRDRYGRMLTDLIIKSLEIVEELGIDENAFRDKLDLIFSNSKIYNGQFNSWSGISPDMKSMELDTGMKNWWSNKKPKKINRKKFQR